MLIFVSYPQEVVLTLLNSLNNLMYLVLQELDLHNNNQLLRAKVSISNNIRACFVCIILLVLVFVLVLVNL